MRRGTLWTAGAVVVVLVAAGGGEVAARSVLRHRVVDAARGSLTGPLDIGLGSRPVLLDLLTGSVPAITVRAPSTSVCGLPGATVDAELTDVHRASGASTAGAVRATVVLRARTLATAVDTALGQSGAAVTPDPAAGLLRVRAGPGGLVEVDERASLSGSTVRLRPAALRVAGVVAPSSLSASLGARADVDRDLSGLPLGLVPRAVAVTGSGLRVDLRGGATPLEGGGASGSVGGAGPCGS